MCAWGPGRSPRRRPQARRRRRAGPAEPRARECRVHRGRDRQRPGGSPVPAVMS
jgi:hypothetical protein